MVDIIEFRPKERRPHERPNRRAADIIPMQRKAGSAAAPSAPELSLDALSDLPTPGATSSD